MSEFITGSELYHHGVLGMKWGRRRKKAPHEDYLKGRTKKSIKELSNDELKELTNRQNLERNYRQAKSQNISTGRKWVSKLLLGTATGVLTGEIIKNEKAGLDFVKNKIFGA